MIFNLSTSIKKATVYMTGTFTAGFMTLLIFYKASAPWIRKTATKLTHLFLWRRKFENGRVEMSRIFMCCFFLTRLSRHKPGKQPWEIDLTSVALENRRNERSKIFRM